MTYLVAGQTYHLQGLTSWSGNLPLDLGELLGESWQESAQGW